MEDNPTIPPLRQYPVSYIRAFAYQPVAFPQPLAPITTYHVSRNQQSYNQRTAPQPVGISAAYSQAIQEQFLQNQQNNRNPGSALPNPLPVIPQPPPNHQLLPQSPYIDFGTTPTTTQATTTTTTTTQAPVTFPPAPQNSFSNFIGSQPIPQVLSRSSFREDSQRQLPQKFYHQSSNYGGFPSNGQSYYYNQPAPSQYQHQQYNDVNANQFSGRVFGASPQFEQYSVDPISYQFIPTSITNIPSAPQNNVKFVPCMCPVAVSISPPIPEKRTEEPIVTVTEASIAASQPIQTSPSTQQVEEESN